MTTEEINFIEELLQEAYEEGVDEGRYLQGDGWEKSSTWVKFVKWVMLKEGI